jgi:hypothetical protein
MKGTARRPVLPLAGLPGVGAWPGTGIAAGEGIDGDSWYNQAIHPADRVRTHIAYENVVVREVFEQARADTGRQRTPA